VSATLRASNDIDGNRVSQARLNDDGWCSEQQGSDIFDPYIEIDFGRNVLFTTITTEGVTDLEIPLIGISLSSFFIEQYTVEVAGKEGGLQYVIPLTNNSQQAEPAVSSYCSTWLLQLI